MTDLLPRLQATTQAPPARAQTQPRVEPPRRGGVYPAVLQALTQPLTQPQPQRGLVAKAVIAGRQLLGAAPLADPDTETDPPRAATIGCIIPAYNEQATIGAVLDALLAQTRLPDVIHVIINNTDDDTAEVVAKYVGMHRRVVKGVPMTTRVQMHDMGANADKKVGALNYGFGLVRTFDFILGVDGDTVLDRHCVEHLELEMVSDTRIGGLSAIYTVGYEQGSGPVQKFLIAGQRAQFGGFNMDNLLRGRNMAVLGGQCSLFRTEALLRVMDHHHQSTPWVRDSEVEDSLLSLQIKKIGYATKISARARATVGGMTTLKALHAQQVKWNYGGIDLMWPGQRGGTQGQPFHPNLRLRWYENISMLLNITTRLAFITLLSAALSIHAFVFNPIWLLPPAVSWLLNIKTASSMHKADLKDWLYAALALPAEAYMWIRMGHFATAWGQFLARIEKDNWAAQANAEGGRKGGLAWAYPLLIAALVVTGTVYLWSGQDVHTKAAILWWGWLMLYTITVTQTVFMLKKTLRRTRGYRV